MELLVVLTVENAAQNRYTDVFTMHVTPAQTRADVYRYAVSQLPAGFRDGHTLLFFSAEPNQITATG